MASPPAPKPSFIPRGFISLSHAIARYGQIAMPDAMREIENAYKTDPRDFEVPTDQVKNGPEMDWLGILAVVARGIGKISQATTIRNEKMREVALEFRHELFEGNISTVIRTRNALFIPVPKQVWGFDDAGHALNAGRVSWTIGAGDQQQAFEGECIIEKQEFEKYLNVISGIIEHESTARILLPKPTAKSAYEVQAAMKRLVEVGVPLTRDGARNEIDKMLGRKSGWREFDKAWGNEAPPSWRRPGAPKKSQQQ